MKAQHSHNLAAHLSSGRRSFGFRSSAPSFERCRFALLRSRCRLARPEPSRRHSHMWADKALPEPQVPSYLLRRRGCPDLRPGRADLRGPATASDWANDSPSTALAGSIHSLALHPDRAEASLRAKPCSTRLPVNCRHGPVRTLRRESASAHPSDTGSARNVAKALPTSHHSPPMPHSQPTCSPLPRPTSCPAP